MSKLHICYAIDDNYVQMCMLSIFNIILHRNPDTEFDFLILGDNLTKTDQFNKFKTIDKVSIKLLNYNSKNLFNFNEKINKTNDYITSSSCLRYLIPQLSEYNNVNKVLYLDADTLILKDLTEMFNINLEDKLIGICKNPVRIIQGYKVMQFFDYIDRCHILNSGIILFNINKCREIKFTEQCIQRTKETGYFDQHIISELFYNQSKLLPPIFNCPYSMIIEPFPYIKDIDIWNLYYGTQYVSIRDLIQQSYIIHFVGDIKYTLANLNLKKIYDEANKRLNKFLQTGIIDYQNIPDWQYYSNLIK